MLADTENRSHKIIVSTERIVIKKTERKKNGIVRRASFGKTSRVRDWNSQRFHKKKKLNPQTKFEGGK